MAARDRWAHGDPTHRPPSTLQRYIHSACDPANYEPNLALNLEVADLINSKKGTAPREAAVAIVNFVNNRNPNVSMLALSVLDICVKNCGYPFHLQISTKEFLNELVRRFPERPPIRPTRVQMRILELIEEWRQTICQTSRYKEDLGFIRDMHRLLLYKGYMFPEIRSEDAAVLNPSDNLKSAEEMEEEEKAAQSAKLQELIRRGGPEDLREANRLMKVMAGYDTKNKTDYRAKAAEEVGKIQQKAKLLEEMLQRFQEGDKMAEGDVYEDLANALQSAQPKIQKMCEEESDDQEAVGKLLEINDSIHRTVERYKLMKKGDIETALKIPKGTLGTTTGVTRNADNELSLIDLGGDGEGDAINDAAGSSKPAVQRLDHLEDDLLGLSFQEKDYGQGGGIALGLGGGPSGSSFMPSQSPISNQNGTPSPSVSPQPATSNKPNYDAFASFASQPQTQTSKPSTPPSMPSVYPQQSPAQSQAQKAPPQISQSDPFAALASLSSSRPSSAFQKSSPSSQVNASSVLSSLSQPPLQQPVNAASAADDEWTFESALPEPQTPRSNTLILKDKPILITFTVSRSPQNTGYMDIEARFANTTAMNVSNVKFQVAVEKAYHLNLTPQSATVLYPVSAAAQQQVITQHIAVVGIPQGSGTSVRMRWKISYTISGEAGPREDQGMVMGLGVL